METSAATGEGVQEVFRTLTTRVLNRIDQGLLDPRSIMIPASSSPPPARDDSDQQQHDSSDTNTTGVMHWCLPPSLMVCWLDAEERREDDTPMKRMGVDGGMDDDGVVG
ncbi:Ras- protein Rab-4A [Perkinsus olseni]|uniref:Ras- protein Rab-4A n=1 Tax=Perkinsus olseni TaxID=32597 RepID=A0A7J6PEG2_PEROL|nr:Ras- protein Rab-4A [Perkinsus olseni]